MGGPLHLHHQRALLPKAQKGSSPPPAPCTGWPRRTQSDPLLPPGWTLWGTRAMRIRAKGLGEDSSCLPPRRTQEHCRRECLGQAACRGRQLRPGGARSLRCSCACVTLQACPDRALVNPCWQC